MLRFGIERARRLVEQQDRRVAQNGAGDRKALTLPAREAHAFLAEKGSEAAWQGIKELGRMRRLGGGADLQLCGARSAEADILPRIGAEDHRILRHQSDALAHLGRIGGAQISDSRPVRLPSSSATSSETPSRATHSVFQKWCRLADRNRSATTRSG